MNAVQLSRDVLQDFISILSSAANIVDVFDQRAIQNPTNDHWGVRWECRYWRQEIEQQNVKFENILQTQLVPRMTIRDVETGKITGDLQNSLWDDEEANLALRSHLEKAYDEFKSKVRVVKTSLQALKTELDYAKSFLRLSGQSEMESQRALWIKRRSQRERLIDSIKKANPRLQKVLDPFGESQSVFSSSSNKHAQDSYVLEFWRNARELHQVFSKSWGCDCIDGHDFKLLLRPKESWKMGLDLLLLPQAHPALGRKTWTHRQISFQISENQPSSRPGAITRFSLPGETRNNLELTEIKDFCRELMDYQDPARCLGILIGEEKKFHVMMNSSKDYTAHPETSCTLETALRKKMLDMPKRTLLAFILASSVLQLYTTAWLDYKWDENHILFFQNGLHSGAVTWEEPYLNVNIKVSENTHWENTRVGLASHTTVIERLWITLLELCFGNLLEDYNGYQEYLPRFGKGPPLELYAAKLWSEEVHNMAGSDFSLAISKCFEMSRGIYSGINKKKWIQEFYTDIIERLRTCCKGALSGDDYLKNGTTSTTSWLNNHGTATNGGVGMHAINLINEGTMYIGVYLSAVTKPCSRRSGGAKH